MLRQRDFIQELEDAKYVDSIEVQELVNRLPAKPLLSVSDVASAICRSPEYVRQLVESGDLKRLAGRDGKRENYLVLRISVIQYLKGKIK